MAINRLVNSNNSTRVRSKGADGSDSPLLAAESIVFKIRKIGGKVKNAFRRDPGDLGKKALLFYDFFLF